jgi:hypothetical protein
MTAPRFDRLMPIPVSMASRGAGRTAMTPKYQNRMTRSGGMLRKIST